MTSCCSNHCSWPRSKESSTFLVDQLRHRLADRELKLEVTPSARHHIAEQGSDPVYVARPLRRFLQHEVETRIGRSLLAGNVEDGSTITVAEIGGRIGRQVPGFNDLADVGFDLAWWPSPSDGRSLYPWVSAVSHHRLYPLIGQLVPSSLNGRPVGRISPDPLELTAGGLVGALAVLRMLDLVFAYLGWPSERLTEVAEDLSLVHQLVKGDDGDDSDSDETVSEPVSAAEITH